MQTNLKKYVHIDQLYNFTSVFIKTQLGRQLNTYQTKYI